MNVRLNNLNSLERQESFGKKNKKADEKQSYTSQPQTGVSKKLKHGFVGAGLALASLLGMSSCVEQSQYMDPPDLDWLKEYLDVTNEKLDQIIENQEEGNSYKAQILEELKKIYEEQKLTNANMEIFRKDLMDLLEQFGIENSQFRAEILEILNNQNMSTQEKYDKIIELMQQIGDKLDKLDSIQNSIDNLEQTVSVGNDKLANLIKEAILEFKDGNLTLQELNLQIAEWVANSNLQNQEVIKKMNQIIEKIEAGQVSEDAALSQIAALLQTISDDVKDIANQLKNSKSEPKPSYLIAQQTPYSDERRGYLLGLSDAIMIHFHDGNRQAMKSLIDWSGVLRRELIHAGAEPEDIDDIDNVMNELPDAVYWGQN